MQALILSNRNGKNAAKVQARFGAFARALRRGRIQAEIRFVDTEEEFRSSLALVRPDIVFPASYFVAPSSSSASSPLDLALFLEERSIPYVGSVPAALDLVLSKRALKDRWGSDGVLTPAYLHAAARGAELDRLVEAAWDFPYIVKPSGEGNSRGIDPSSVVFSGAELRARAASVIENFGEVIVEQYLGRDPSMREFTVALLGEAPRDLLLPAEIILEGRASEASESGAPLRVVTTADKESGRARAEPLRDPALRARLSEAASRAFVSAGVRDYARCDLIESGGRLYALEINGEPMVPDPWFAACAAGAGLDSSQYLLAIFAAALSRLEREGRVALRPPEALRLALPEDVFRRLSRP